METQPVVSVLMITYNHERYIAQAIEGVLNQQTQYSCELVIGEDCSTDRTREIVLDYQRRYPHIIRVITSNANVGMHQNFYRTAMACSGEYVAMCEGDDWWHDPAKLQTQVSYLRQYPDVCLLAADAYRASDDGTIQSEVRDCKHRTAITYASFDDLMLGRQVIFTPTAVFKRLELLEILTSTPELTSFSYPMIDVQLWFELSRRGKVVIMTARLATYRHSINSVSRPQDVLARLRFSLGGTLGSQRYLYKYGLSTGVEDTRRALAKRTRIVIEYSLQLGEFRLAADNVEQLRDTNIAFTLKDYLFALCVRMPCLVSPTFELLYIFRRLRSSLMPWSKSLLGSND